MGTVCVKRAASDATSPALRNAANESGADHAARAASLRCHTQDEPPASTTIAPSTEMRILEPLLSLEELVVHFDISAPTFATAASSLATLARSVTERLHCQLPTVHDVASALIEHLLALQRVNRSRFRDVLARNDKELDLAAEEADADAKLLDATASACNRIERGWSYALAWLDELESVVWSHNTGMLPVSLPICLLHGTDLARALSVWSGEVSPHTFVVTAVVPA